MSRENILAYEADKYARRLEVEPGDTPNAAETAEINREAAQELARLSDDTPLEQPSQQEQSPQRRSGGGDGKGNKTVTHKVEPGETLSSIASKYNVTTQDLKSWNNLTRNSLRTGQMLRVTTTADIAEATGAREVSPNGSYTPKQQDRKSDAKKESVSSKKKSNNSSAKKSKKKTKTAAPKSHTVKSGDNLSTIAKRYGTTVSALKKANGLSSDKLRPGQKLKLPEKATKKSKKKKKR